MKCKHKGVIYSRVKNKWQCLQCHYEFKNLEEWREQRKIISREIWKTNLKSISL